MMPRKSFLAATALALFVVSCTLSLSAHSTYGYRWSDVPGYEGIDIHGGIWKYCFQGECKSYKDEDITNIPSTIKAARVCIIADHVSCIPLGILLIMILLPVKDDKGALIIAALLCAFLHQTFILLTSVCMTTDFKRVERQQVGWGSGLTWLSWFLSFALLADLFILSLSFQGKKTQQPQMDDKPQLIVSEQPPGYSLFEEQLKTNHADDQQDNHHKMRLIMNSNCKEQTQKTSF